MRQRDSCVYSTLRASSLIMAHQGRVATMRHTNWYLQRTHSHGRILFSSRSLAYWECVNRWQCCV